MISSKLTISGLIVLLLGVALFFGKDNVWLITLSLTSFCVGLLLLLIGYAALLLENRHD